jgi:hypothetical protein
MLMDQPSSVTVDIDDYRKSKQEENTCHRVHRGNGGRLKKFKNR